MRLFAALGIAASLTVGADVYAHPSAAARDALSEVEGQAQGRGGRAGGGPPPSPRATAPQDLTGYWVSVVTEYWHLRMLVPAKGDFAMLPLNPDARTAANAYDAAREKAAGSECSVYGAPAIMRVPGRFYIHWADDNTLQMDIDSGTQTRMFRFAPPQGRGAPSESRGGAAPAAAEASWQGQSVAEWQYTRVPPRTGELKVVTNRLRPGYLRKNGVPYGANATMTEYFHRTTAPNGDTWITVVSELIDPENLREPFVQSTHFKKLPANATFKSEPCDAR